jgi:hypothetical protein
MEGRHAERTHSNQQWLIATSRETTRFSGVEFQLLPTTNVGENKDTTDFSRVEFQFQPPICGRLKLRLHTAEAGGVLPITELL